MKICSSNIEILFSNLITQISVRLSSLNMLNLLPGELGNQTCEYLKLWLQCLHLFPLEEKFLHTSYRHGTTNSFSLPMAHMYESAHTHTPAYTRTLLLWQIGQANEVFCTSLWLGSVLPLWQLIGFSPGSVFTQQLLSCICVRGVHSRWHRRCQSSFLLSTVNYWGGPANHVLKRYR